MLLKALSNIRDDLASIHSHWCSAADPYDGQRFLCRPSTASNIHHSSRGSGRVTGVRKTVRCRTETMRTYCRIHQPCAHITSRRVQRGQPGDRVQFQLHDRKNGIALRFAKARCTWNRGGRARQCDWPRSRRRALRPTNQLP